MTCIVGLFDKEKDCVYIGADSLVSMGNSKALLATKKVFKAKDNKNILMGVAGRLKVGNILSVEDKFIEEIKELKNEVNFEHIVKYTAPRIMRLTQQYNVSDKETTMYSEVIFAYKNQLYQIGCDGSVAKFADDYCATGSGEEFAIGVLAQNGDKPIVERIKEALAAAEKHAVGVQRPFYIMNTLNDEVIEVL